MADAGQMLDKFLKLPDYQKLISLGAVIALLVVGYYYGIHAPKALEYETKQQELIKLNAQHSEQERVLANIREFQAGTAGHGGTIRGSLETVAQFK